MGEIRTLNGNTFIDEVARENIEQIKKNGLGESAVSKSALHDLLIPILCAGLYESDQSANISALKEYLYTGEEIHAESVSLSHDIINISAGISKTLVATVQPANTTDIARWSSSNKSVATVQGGVITPVSDGVCDISVQVGEHIATCRANVRMKNIIINDGADVACGILDRNPTAGAYSRIAYVTSGLKRAVFNPLAFYITPGKKYKFGLTDTSTYLAAFYLFDQTGERIDFSYTNGTSKIFYMSFEEVLDSGWLQSGNPAEFTADTGTNLISVMFRKKDESDLTETDLEALKKIVVLEEVIE